MPVRYAVTPIYVMLQQLDDAKFSVEDYNLAMDKYEVHSIAVTSLEFAASTIAKQAALEREVRYFHFPITPYITSERMQ